MNREVLKHSEKCRLRCRRELEAYHNERREKRSAPVRIAAGRRISSSLWTKVAKLRLVQ